jgi:hypothetical protein
VLYVRPRHKLQLTHSVSIVLFPERALAYNHRLKYSRIELDTREVMHVRGFFIFRPEFAGVEDSWSFFVSLCPGVLQRPAKETKTPRNARTGGVRLQAAPYLRGEERDRQAL